MTPFPTLLTRLCQRFARIRAVARIEALQLFRDRPSLSLILMVPAIQIILFGYAVDLNPRNVPIALAGHASAQSDPVGKLVADSNYFTVVETRLPPGGAEQAVRQRRALIGIELPPPVDPYESDEVSRPARVFVDGTDPAAVRPALSALQQGYAQRLAGASARKVQIEWLYNPEARTAWTIVPGLIGVIVMISMLMLGALTLVREREHGSWESLLATPVTALDALIGKLTPYLLIALVQAAVVLGLAHLLFDLPVRGSFGWFMAAMPLFAAAHLVLGFALSALVASQMQAIQAAVFFYLPSMLLSGFMFPFNGMPQWARIIGEILPLTHFVRIARGVLLRGDGAALVAQEIVPVAAFTAAALALALAAYRRRLD